MIPFASNVETVTRGQGVRRLPRRGTRSDRRRPAEVMAKANDLKVLLVRAASTEWDEAGRICGKCDLSASKSGREALIQAAEGLNGSSPPLILTSGDAVSRESAELLASGSGARVRVVEGLGEIDFGLWEGLREQEVKDRYPTAYRQWEEDPTGVSVPGGESLADAESRVLMSLSRSLEKVKESSVAVVLRPVVLGLVRCWLTGRSTRGLWDEVESAPAMEWHVVSRVRLKDVREALRS